MAVARTATIPGRFMELTLNYAYTTLGQATLADFFFIMNSFNSFPDISSTVEFIEYIVYFCKNSTVHEDTSRK